MTGVRKRKNVMAGVPAGEIMRALSSPGNASDVATRRPGDVEEHGDDKMAFRADEGRRSF